MAKAHEGKILRLRDAAIVVAFAALLAGVWQYTRRNDMLRGATLLEKADSFYNTIYVYGTKDGVRHMVFGYQRKRYFESAHRPGAPLEMELAYTRMMTVGLAYVPEPKHVLSIGMGGGAVSSYLLAEMPGPRVTEVELDPEVVRLSKKWFDYADTPRRTVVVEDGRRFLMEHQDTYDMIMLDAYRGPFVPFHLLTTEFYAQVKQHLAPGGVVVQNIASGTLLLDSTLATMEKAFANVDYYETDENAIAVAYDGPRRTDAELRAAAGADDAKSRLVYPLSSMVEGRKIAENTKAKVLTDDFAPVDALNAIDSHNRKWE
jgi:spermidine synthase